MTKAQLEVENANLRDRVAKLSRRLARLETMLEDFSLLQARRSPPPGAKTPPLPGLAAKKRSKTMR